MLCCALLIEASCRSSPSDVIDEPPSQAPPELPPCARLRLLWACTVLMLSGEQAPERQATVRLHPPCRHLASGHNSSPFNLRELCTGSSMLSDSITGRIDPSSEPAPPVPHLWLLPWAPHHGQPSPAIPQPGCHRKDVRLDFSHLIDHLTGSGDQRTDPSSTLPTTRPPTPAQVLFQWAPNPTCTSNQFPAPPYRSSHRPRTTSSTGVTRFGWCRCRSPWGASSPVSPVGCQPMTWPTNNRGRLEATVGLAQMHSSSSQFSIWFNLNYSNRSKPSKIHRKFK
jgi:hypothetical protein